MISPISFKSVYRVNNKNKEAYSKFQDYTDSIKFNNDVSLCNKNTATERKTILGRFNKKVESILVVPDNMDYDVETFCFNNGISYKKQDIDSFLAPKAIVKRVVKAPKNYKEVFVNSKKLEEIIDKQNTNIKQREFKYNNYCKDIVDMMIKSGEKFPATTLSITLNTLPNIPAETAIKLFDDYINRYGEKELNYKQLNVEFTKRTKAFDDYTYFAFKDMGIENIPVYVDDNTYRIGQILHLFN